MERKDVRECEGYWEKLAGYLERAQSASEIWRNLYRDFPHAKVPRSPDYISTWLNLPGTWRGLKEHVGEERARKLWAKYELQLNANGRTRSRPRPTIDQLLSPPAPARPKLGARVRR